MDQKMQTGGIPERLSGRIVDLVGSVLERCWNSDPKNARGPVSFMVSCKSSLPRVTVQSIEESDDLCTPRLAILFRSTWHKLDVVSVQIH